MHEERRGGSLTDTSIRLQQAAGNDPEYRRLNSERRVLASQATEDIQHRTTRIDRRAGIAAWGSIIVAVILVATLFGGKYLPGASKQGAALDEKTRSEFLLDVRRAVQDEIANAPQTQTTDLTPIVASFDSLTKRFEAFQGDVGKKVTAAADEAKAAKEAARSTKKEMSAAIAGIPKEVTVHQVTRPTVQAAQPAPAAVSTQPAVTSPAPSPAPAFQGSTTGQFTSIQPFTGTLPGPTASDGLTKSGTPICFRQNGRTYISKEVVSQNKWGNPINQNRSDPNFYLFGGDREPWRVVRQAQVLKVEGDYLVYEGEIRGRFQVGWIDPADQAADSNGIVWSPVGERFSGRPGTFCRDPDYLYQAEVR